MGWGMSILNETREMASAIDAIAASQADLKADMEALSNGASENQMAELLAKASDIQSELVTLSAIVIP